MTGRRYTVVLADRSSGVIRQLTVNVRIAAGLVFGILALPILMGLGAKWSARNEIDQLRAERSILQVENGSYRAATGELTAQIQSLETVINDLGVRSQLDPAQARAMQKLPAVVKTRATGGTNVPANIAVAEMAKAAFATPEDTFGVLRDLLQGLESRLRSVRSNVERREALASSTPSIWPAHGWLTGTFGGRSDPFSGEPAFHQGLDRRRHRRDRFVHRRLRQPDRHQARLWSRDPLRPLEPVQREAGQPCQARRRHRLCRRHRPRHRRARALRDPGERAADQPASAVDCCSLTVNQQGRKAEGRKAGIQGSKAEG
jgi:hypothetical protein